MPNHVENHLFVISKDNEEHQKFRDAVYEKGDDKEEEYFISFHKLFPAPKSVDEFIEQVQSQSIIFNRRYLSTNCALSQNNTFDISRINVDDDYHHECLREHIQEPHTSLSYHWGCMVYGTKWGAYDFWVQEQRNPYITEYKFCSAWTPPVYGLLNLQRRFPTMDFYLEYTDLDMDMHGFLMLVQGGVQHSDEQNDMNMFNYARKKALAEQFEILGG